MLVNLYLRNRLQILVKFQNEVSCCGYIYDFHRNSSGILVQSVSFNDAFELVNMRLGVEQHLACVLKSNLQCKLLAILCSSITCLGKTSFCFPEKVTISAEHALMQVLTPCSTQCSSTRPKFMLSDHLLF